MTDQAVPQHLRVLITHPWLSPADFEQLRQELLAAGAQFNEPTRDWFVFLDAGDATGMARTLSSLFTIASRFSAHVTVQPPEEWAAA